ncbi:MAG: hypothetical protein WCP45_13205 [Verrucomicrobiota bacterium]
MGFEQLGQGCWKLVRSYYQERDRLRLLIHYRDVYLHRLLTDGEEAAGKTADDYQREANEKDQEFDSTAAALKGKRELSEEETAKLKKLWKKLVRMFHPDQYEHDPEKRKTYERLTQAINEARDQGDIELLERIAKDPQAFILQQGWAAVALDGSNTLAELRALYEHLRARILELIETLDDLRVSPDFQLYQFAEQDAAVIPEVIEGQKGELEKEIEALEAEAQKKAAEIKELVGESPI